jgi:ribonucleoside-triphosphate reductase
MHYPEAEYCIRRMRVSEHSSLVQKCIDAGYHVERDVVSVGTMVISIPVQIKNVRTVDQVSMWEQLSLAAFIQKNWADNQVSCTVTFQKHEADQIKNALNYFQYQLKGISFLPKTEKGAYAQMPYEQITQQVYTAMKNNITPLDFSGVGEDSIPEKYCDSQGCEVVLGE